MAGGATLLVGYLSVIVLLPIAALAAHGLGLSIHTHGAGLAFWDWSVHTDFAAFWSAVTQPNARAAIWLSLWLSLAVAAVNAVAGIAIAWVLVRDDFVGKRVVEAVIDLPFALPTIVAGVVFLFLYGVKSPVHVTLFETVTGLLVALLFVTLPFSVRAVQPVLASLDGQAEAAARTLGAGSFRTFRTVVLPSLLPAVLSGFGLAFARAVGEFGSITLIAGGLAKTTTASILIFSLIGAGKPDVAASVSVALLVLSLLLLAGSSALARRISKRLSS
ncbi:MAG TPA: ABC transporter permease subunit [Acidimicrobiales bacterium]|jgi:sulfate transport system permease protein|nr:ABC transporter permease subunit [Acidimicrobiales bacterium]